MVNNAGDVFKLRISTKENKSLTISKDQSESQCKYVGYIS